MQVSLNEPAMEQAWGVIKQLSADEQERLEAETAEKARRDLVARIRSAEMRGREEGLTEGRSAERSELIHNMLSEGLTIEQIVTFTKLSSDEIQSIATNNTSSK